MDDFLGSLASAAMDGIEFLIGRRTRWVPYSGEMERLGIRGGYYEIRRWWWSSWELY